MRPRLLFIAIILFIASSCHQTQRQAEPAAPVSACVDPPIRPADVPYKIYSVMAENGDTLFYPTGSIILFPPHAFVDKNGNPVKGNIQIKYREFTSSLDLYLSGIPMTFDSGGTTYLFESTGMCEIYGFKDGMPVYINPVSKPEIYLTDGNDTVGYNIYRLDTIQKKWINKGVRLELQTRGHKYSLSKSGSTPKPFPEPPVKPQKANNKSPVFRIVIDSSSFKELMNYNNLRFQVDERHGKKFDPRDAATEWSNVELQKGERRGLYKIKFSNQQRTVTYLATPVLTGADYSMALEQFEIKRKEYRDKLSLRLKKEQEDDQEFKKETSQANETFDINQRVEKLNALIDARNKSIPELAEKLERDSAASNAMAGLYQSFRIDSFGVWNCDRARYVPSFVIDATFTDSLGNLRPLSNIATIQKSFRGITRSSSNAIVFYPNTGNMIVGAYQGRFAYVSFEDCAKLHITPETKHQTFIVTIVSDENNNYEYIKRIAGIGIR